LQRSIAKHRQEIGKPGLNQAVETAEAVEPRQEEDLFKANLTDPSPRDQQDLMSLPFFSLSKTKRTEPIIYEQGNVKVEVNGLAKTGIATIWDADLLIWIASQLNTALEAGERPTRRLWIVPYQFLTATKRMSPHTKGYRAYLQFKDCLRRLQGTTVETTIKAGGKQIIKAWSWIDSWEVHEDEHGRMTGVEIILSEWFFRRVVDDRSILAIHTDYFLLTGGIERWLYRIVRKHCGNNVSGWSFTLYKLYEKYPPGREFRKFKHDLKTIVKLDCLPEYHIAWETSNGVDWVHFYLRQGAIGGRKLPRSLRGSA
jgi:plasmid replication initiation protein